ncbi:MAG: hypothetical protein KDN19_16300 [Verrucomicrobiae bacterium]|nr:hypothetical protein [Verrucomicrobiae bacterium]
MAVIAGAVSCSLLAASSQDQAGNGNDAESSVAEEKPEAAIPQPYPVERYLGVWMKSPFQLEAAGEVMVTQQSFARDYVLTGLIQDGEKSIAYIQNSKTGETTRIATDEPADGFELIDAHASPDPRAASVEVRHGNETATLKYGDATFAQAATPPTGAPPVGVNGNNVNPGRPAPVRPGQSGALPGRPANPNQATANGNAGGSQNGGTFVNPAQARLQQLRERQQQGGEEEKEPTPRSRRRVILPSQAGRSD